MSQNLRGDKHPTYKGPGGRGILQVLYHRVIADPRWKTCRDEVMHRAEGKCQDCGRDATDAHHKQAVIEALRLLFEPDFCEALCQECHTAKHFNP